jgi:hypothetical protein
MSKRYFRVETIINYDEENERREVTYESASTARVMLKRRGVHLAKDEKATSNHLYASETEGVWVIYWRCSREQVRAASFTGARERPVKL